MSFEVPESDLIGGRVPDTGGQGGFEVPESDKQPATPSPSLLQKADVTAQGAIGTGLETSGMAGGMAAGFAATLPIPIPGARVAGTILGGIIGYKGGEGARNLLSETPLTFRDVEELPDDLRPYGIAGESFGGALPFALTPMGLAAANYRIGGIAGDTAVGGWLNNVINTAKTNPRAYMSQEMIQASAAAAAGGTSQYLFPGEEGTQMGAEMVGGFLSSFPSISALAQKTVDVTRTVIANLSPAARESVAAAQLQQAVRIFGEDPHALAEAVRQVNILPGVDLTLPQRLDSPALDALHRAMIEHSVSFGEDSRRVAQEGMDTIETMIVSLGNLGDAKSMRAAAALRMDYFKTLIKSRISAAEHRAGIAALSISRDTPRARLQLGTDARRVIDDVLTETINAEKELWAKVPGELPAGVNVLRSVFNEELARTPVELRDVFPGEIAAFLTRIAKNGGESSIDELKQMRTHLGNMSRQAEKELDYGSKRIYDKLSMAILEDMTSVFDVARLLGDTDLADAYDVARQFTEARHDVFTRSFTGKAIAVGKYGDQMSPEMIVQRALATGKEAGAIQLADLEEASRFMLDRGGDSSKFNKMMDIQERIVRLAAADAIDPITGKVKEGQLATFIRNNEALLDRFPHVRADLQSAVDSELGRQSITAIYNGRLKNIGVKSVTARILKDDPIKVVSGAMTSTDPETEITKLIKVSDDPVYREGLRAAFFDAAVINSSPNGNLSLDNLRNNLLKPLVEGRKPPLDVMKDSGVVSQEHYEKLVELFDLSSNINKTQKSGSKIEIGGDTTEKLITFMSRVIGSVTVRHGLAPHGGATIQAAGAGANFADAMMAKAGRLRIKNIITESLSNQELLITLLEKPTSPIAQTDRARRIHAYFLSAGFYGALDTDDMSFDPDATDDEMQYDTRLAP